MSLKGSVGRTAAATNNGDDVKLVQRLLNSVLMAKTKTCGQFGATCVGFNSAFCAAPNGRGDWRKDRCSDYYGSKRTYLAGKSRMASLSRVG
ncbi:MAG TPA: hypothetical protein VMH26_14145, partial [Burkholderiales bacterium]|nr:hypothetical protein [Burkholderiales bacterium]